METISQKPLSNLGKNKDFIDNQFKKGQSGNPAGRPAGTVSVVAELKKKLQEIPDGQKKTYLEIFVMKIFKKSMQDEDVTMMRDLIDRVDGKPEQSTNINLKTAQPVTLELIKKYNNSKDEIKE